MNTLLMDYEDSTAIAHRNNETKNIHQLDAELNMAVLTLYDNGIIRDCSQAGFALLGCSPDKLSSRHISAILPQLADVALMQGECINPNLRFLSYRV